MIVSGSSNIQLAKELAREAKKPLAKIKIAHFADGEIYVRFNENVRGSDLFIIQSTNTNNNLMELLILIDAAKRASAERITAVIPYYGYARQDRKAKPREPITAKLVANLITTAGAHRILSVDLHCPQIQGFFDIPLDDTWALPLFANYLYDKKMKNLVVVSPDAGGVTRARRLAKILHASMAVIDKRRTDHNVGEVMHILGDVSGKNAIIIDDIIDTGGSIVNATNAVKKQGAKNIFLCATHPVFSKDAILRLVNSVALEIIVTNSIPFQKHKKIKVLSLGKMLGKSILSIHKNESVSLIHKEILKRNLQ